METKKPAPVNQPTKKKKPAGADANSIEAVRDLLFGRELTEIERRFADMEQRLASQLTNMQAVVNRRLEELQNMMRESFEVSEKSTIERFDRQGEENTRFEKGLKTVDDKVTRSSDELTDAIGKVVKEFQDQLFSQHKFMGREIEETRSKMTNSFDGKLTALQQSHLSNQEFGHLLGAISQQMSERERRFPTPPLPKVESVSLLKEQESQESEDRQESQAAVEEEPTKAPKTPGTTPTPTPPSPQAGSLLQMVAAEPEARQPAPTPAPRPGQENN